MKKTILYLLSFTTLCKLQAQSIDEAKDFIAHERYKSAENTLHTLLQQKPDQAEAWYWLAESYIAQNESNNAADSLQKAIALSGQPYYQVAYGSILLQQGKADSAQNYFSQALSETKEKDAGILAAIARAEVEAPKGNIPYALELIEKAQKRDKKDISLVILKGDAYSRQHNGSEAYKAYTDATNRDSKNAVAYTRIGDIFLTQKNSEIYLDYYNKAVAADPTYAPAWYQLYQYYFYHDPSRAMEYFDHYNSNTDKDIKNKYAYTDLLYLTKKYPEAIENANQLLGQPNGQPRLYKLLAYSYEGLKDTSKAITNMNLYFTHEADSNFIAKDYESMAAWQQGNMDSAMFYYSKAVDLVKDSAARYAYFKKLADMSEKNKNYSAQALWLGKYNSHNDRATNLDLFNWGLANFRAGQYEGADSVFGKYTEKYPEQGFGYYWRARANVAIDTAMEKGLAIPHYQKLVEIISKDSTNATNKKWLVEAYAYMAAYETNTKKDYPQAISYFEKLLAIDPNNADAKKYVAILQKRVEDNNSSK